MTQVASVRAGVRASRAAATSVSRPGVLAAAGVSLLAGWVHLAYTSAHLRAWWAYGAFFLVVGLGQGLLAAALLRWPRPVVAIAGIAGNLGVVMMYVVTRSGGIPLGPHKGVVEKATTIDLLTTAGEVVVIVLLLAMLGHTACRVTVNVLVLCGALLWAGRLTDTLP
jgi:hypothetical protein